MKFKEVYDFAVMDEIEDGNTVFVLDKESRTVNVVNEMTVNDAVAVIRDAGRTRDRFEFWYEDNTVEEEEVNE